MDSSSAESSQQLPQQMLQGLTRATETAARNHRVAAGARAELEKHLASDELQALMDRNQDFETQIAQARARLAGEQKAAERWQERLSAAVEAWNR